MKIKKLKPRQVTKTVGGGEGHPLGGPPTPLESYKVHEYSSVDIANKLNEVINYLHENCP